MLVARHQGKVRGYLRQLTRDPAAADDLAQDAFIRAWDRLETFGGKGRFLSWMLAIAHKEFLQAERRQRRSRRLADELELASLVDSGDLRTGDDPDPADLPLLLSALSDAERTAVVLSYGCGLSHGEIAEVTGLPLGTVKSHILRGRDRIRRRFGLEQTDDG